MDVQMALNSAIHKGIGDIPHHILYERDPSIPGVEQDVDNTEEKLARMRLSYAAVKEVMEENHRHTERYYNRGKKEKSNIHVGDLVFKKGLLPVGPLRKFKERFLGPYRVDSIAANGVTVKIKSLVHHKIYKVHINNLKKFHNIPNTNPFPTVEAEEENEVDQDLDITDEEEDEEV